MKPGLSRTILGGLAGTTVMTLMMYFISPMMGVRMDIAASLGGMLGGSWTMGMMMHFLNGAIIFPLLYAFLLFRLLPGGPLAKGIGWGLILWLLAQVMVMPMMGGGFFSSRMGGMPAVMGSLLGHLIYGALLGWIGGSTPSSAASRPISNRYAA
ncbi:MAG TPA: DUF6789 family protein [Terriglobales bacterium]|nr:DUF6789 family protein [Terriglobales bacterium]